MAAVRLSGAGSITSTASRLLLSVYLLCWLPSTIEALSDNLPIVNITSAGQEILIVENSDVILQLTCRVNVESSSVLTWVRGRNSVLELSQDEPGISLRNDPAALVLTITVSEANSDGLASREGLPYYCQAKNSLGTARSQEVILRYPSFEGFIETVENERVMVRTGDKQAVVLHCGYVGAPVPKPQVTWFRDQEPIVIDSAVALPHYRILEEGELVIYNLENSDIMNSNSETVQYRCRVDNVRMVENQTSPFFYTLHTNEINTLSVDPTIYITPPASIFLMKNEPAVLYFLYASNRGAPDLVATQIPPLGDIFEDEPNRRVLLNSGVQRNSTIQIRANYIVPGVGLEGYNPRIETNTAVILIEPLVVDASTTRNQVFQGFTNETTYNFICNASGSQLALAWYKDGERVPVNGPTLTISKPVPNDSGVYQCFWTSQLRPSQIFDSVSWALVVRDRVPPNVVSMTTSGPLDNNGRAIVPEGTMVTINLTVRSDVKPQISWIFTNLDGTGGPLDTSDETLYQTNISFLGEELYQLHLTLVRMTVTTSGWYSPVIDDGFTEPSVGRTRFVSIEFPAQVTSIVSSHTCLLAGEVVSIMCEVKGLPEPYVSFLKNSKVFQVDQCQACDVSGNVLTFSVVTRDDQGSYGCTARNTNEGETITDSRSLNDGTVLVYCDHPEVTVVGSSDVTATEGDNVILTCQVTSIPPPAVTWMFNGTNGNISNDGYTTTQTSNGDYSLIIDSVTTSNNGTYTCQVNNTAIPEVVREEINLAVNPKVRAVAYWSVVAVIGGVLLVVILISLGFLCSFSYYSKKFPTPEARRMLVSHDNDECNYVDWSTDEEDGKGKESLPPQPTPPPRKKAKMLVSEDGKGKESLPPQPTPPPRKKVMLVSSASTSTVV